MADIFISYSHKDRKTADDLAKFLAGLGYDVWWDYELISGDNFRNEILKQLRASKAAVVIWSPFSVDLSLSKWPREEAEEADRLGILVPTRVPELEYPDIPLGFRGYHTGLVTEPDNLLKAFEKLGVVPSPSKNVQPAPAAPVVIDGRIIDPGIVDTAQVFAHWKRIEESKSAKDYRDFLAVNQDSPLAEVARLRLAEFERTEYEALRGEFAPKLVQKFLRDYPESPHRNDLTRRLYQLETAAWDAIARSNDPDKIAAFLATFPDGHRTAEARERLRELRLSVQEAAAWKKLGPAPTAEMLESFVKLFPLGAYADEARVRLKAVQKAEKRAKRWREVKDQPYNEPIRTFIAEFEDGPEVEAARKMLIVRRNAREDADWAKVRGERHPAPILAFLLEHQGGVHENAATALLKELPSLNETEAWSVVRDSGRQELLDAFARLFPSSKHLPAPTNAGAATSAFGHRGPPPSHTAKRSTVEVPAPSPVSTLSLLSAVIAAAVSGAAVRNSLPNNGLMFGFGMILGPTAIVIVALFACWRAFRRGCSVWSLMTCTLAFHAVAAAWACAIFFYWPLQSYDVPKRQASLVWLGVALAVLVHHVLVGGWRGSLPVNSIMRGWARIVFGVFALASVVAVAALSAIGLAGEPTFRPASLQCLYTGSVNPNATGSSQRTGCSEIMSYFISASIIVGLATAATGCLALIRAIWNRALWGQGNHSTVSQAASRSASSR